MDNSPNLERCIKASAGLIECLAGYKLKLIREACEGLECKLSGKTAEIPVEPLYESDHRVLYREGSMRILSYTDTPTPGNPLLIVPSMINRYYILDLMSDCSFVKFMAEKNIDVYLIDWGIPGYDSDHLPLSYFSDKMIGRAVHQVRMKTGKKPVIMGYCMGGTMSCIYSALHPADLSGFISLAAPYDFNNNDSLSIMARSLDVDRLADGLGRIGPDVLQSGFILAQPAVLYGKAKSLYQNGDDEKRNRVFTHLERWLNDNIAFPREAYREYIKAFYQKNQLFTGDFSMNGKIIRISDIRIPVLNIIASEDSIVPEKAAMALTEKVSSEINDVIRVDAGHIGVIMGRKAAAAWGQIYDWHCSITEKEI